MGEDNRGKGEEGFSGTTVKDTWTKPRGGGIRGGRWGWLGWGEVVRGKCRQLYLNSNKIIKKKEEEPRLCTEWSNASSVLSLFGKRKQRSENGCGDETGDLTSR